MSTRKFSEAHDPIDATVRAPSSWGFDDRPRGTPPPIPALRPRGSNYLVAVSPPRRRSLPPPIPPLRPRPRAATVHPLVIAPFENQHGTASSQPLINELAVPWFENTSNTVPVQPQPASRRAAIVVALGALTVTVFVVTFLVLRWVIRS